MRCLPRWCLLLVCLAGAGLPLAADEKKEGDQEEKVIETKSGLKYVDLKKGLGEQVDDGDYVTVHYVGWFASDGKQFDSSRDRKEPFSFTVGKGEVIRGWEEGVLGMQPGAKRKLMVPWILAYGERGNQGVPPRADLVFEVELLRLRKVKK